VRAGYAGRAAADPARFARLDAGGTLEQVRAQVLAVLEARGW
jgi:dTMP kinase